MLKIIVYGLVTWAIFTTLLNTRATTFGGLCLEIFLTLFVLVTVMAFVIVVNQVVLIILGL